MAEGFDGVNGDFAGRLQGLMGVCPGITLTSGFRTRDEQARLYAQKPDLAAPPGHSNHERGVAYDIGGNLECAHAHAAEYGLTFPMGHEPWHIEPAGLSDQSSPDAYTADPSGMPVAHKEVGDYLSAFSAVSADGVDAVLSQQGEVTEGGGRVGATATATAAPGVPGAPPTGDQIERMMYALRMSESGGDYGAHSGSSSASGAYQFINSTWGGYGGYRTAAEAPPEVQDQRARELLTAAFAHYGGDPRAVAQSWFYPKGVGNDGLTPPGNSITMGEYADRVMGYMG